MLIILSLFSKALNIPYDKDNTLCVSHYIHGFGKKMHPQIAVVNIDILLISLIFSDHDKTLNLLKYPHNSPKKLFHKNMCGKKSDWTKLKWKARFVGRCNRCC